VSALAIALVISVHGLGGEIVALLTGEHVPVTIWITTVVIGGAILTEILVTITSPPTRAARPRTAELSQAGAAPISPPTDDTGSAAVIDELDEPEHPRDDGPVYRDDEELPPMRPRDPTLTNLKKQKP